MMEILIPILAVTVIGLICAVGLAVASSVMAVKEDTRFTEIRACLPGANCGACGYTGCDGYAKGTPSLINELRPLVGARVKGIWKM